VALLPIQVIAAEEPLANINGVSIYSDKSMSSIVNSKVTFSDGSWCDVSTGEVVNTGPGYISCGGTVPTAGVTKQETLGPTSYSADQLDVRTIAADVVIQPFDGEKTEVTINGPQSKVKNVNVSLDESTLIIVGKEVKKRSGHGINIISGSAIVGSNITMSSSQGSTNIIMSSGSNANDVKITVRVPRGLAITVAGVQGTVTIGDTGGSLHARVLGGDDITAGNVRDANLSVLGGGEIAVKSVQGSLSMDLQGSGDIRVSDGSVTTLNATSTGSGDIDFDGEAVDANLSLTGSGDIKVASVQNKPNTTIVGTGDITIGNW